jgi:hypothetical protein
VHQDPVDEDRSLIVPIQARSRFLSANRELAKRLGVGLGTVHGAFAQLQKEGFVQRRSRRGTFVGQVSVGIPTALDMGVLFRAPREWSRDDNDGIQTFHGIPPAHAALHDWRVLDNPAFRQIMSAMPVPTAVFTSDDYVARYVLNSANQMGLRVPEHVSVVSLLDLGFAARTEPPLTTMRFEPEAIGRAAVEEVVACCREPGRAPQSHPISGQWVERGSLKSTNGKEPMP